MTGAFNLLAKLEELPCKPSDELTARRQVLLLKIIAVIRRHKCHTSTESTVSIKRQ